jgi:tetratricopeptide (TPR) repeat protein
MSFAKSLIEQEDYDRAIEVATEELATGHLEPLLDRATAYELSGQFEAALADFELCITQNRERKELDGFQLDDAYFGAMVSYAQAKLQEDTSPQGRSAAAEVFLRYAKTCPQGAHRQDADVWFGRMSGAAPSLLDKTVDM